MIIRQISVFIENKPGRISAALDALAANKIDISALSFADATDYGVLRLIVDDSEKARDVLSASGVVVRITHVIALAMDDAPGGAGGIMRTLANNNINVNYLYAFVGKVSGKAIIVIRADDNKIAEEILRREGFGDVNPADVYRIGE